MLEIGSNFCSQFLCHLKEEKLRGRPGYEHLNDPLHILIEADLPANIVDIRLRQAQEIIEELLKPVVCNPSHSPQFFISRFCVIYNCIVTAHLYLYLPFARPKT